MGQFQDRRTQLHDLLVETLGSSNVYFQPPASVRIKYPCIVYARENPTVEYADDSTYLLHHRYQITLIYEDPDSDLPDKIAQLPMCRPSSQSVVDNLYHFVCSMYF